MTPSDELADRIDYNRSPGSQRKGLERDQPSIVKRETSGPSLSLSLFSRSHRASDQFAAINAGQTFRIHARELREEAREEAERRKGESATRHTQFNTWPKWFVSA